MTQRPAPGRRAVDDPAFTARIDQMIQESGGDPASYDGRLIRELVEASFKLITDRRDTGELKLLTHSFKELRYAYTVFDDYAEPHKISIFGSARTSPDHPDYKLAVEFSRQMAERNWLCITGAGDGIMKAGHEGPGREASFGLAIRLPFETTANDVILNDEKLIHFKYFFTRKLMFVSQCEAVAVFPGGFGTLDELFESLTLIQTGKSALVPIVLMDHEDGVYWKHWENYVEHSLLGAGMISPEDVNLYHITSDPKDAVEHVCRFYRNYHSSRYVRDDMVIRIKRPLREEDVAALHDEFGEALVASGRIEQRGALDGEGGEFPELPRLVFHHTRRAWGVIRLLIDRINECDPAGPMPQEHTPATRHPYPQNPDGAHDDPKG